MTVYLLYETHEYEDFLLDVLISRDVAEKRIEKLKARKGIPFYYKYRIDEHEVKEE